MDTDVIIVGAGPVGLMLAGELRLGGARVVVLERLAEPTTESRASTLHARTMEIFDQRDLLNRLGTPPSQGSGHFGGIPLDFANVPTRYSGQWKVLQTRVEELLAGWATELGADIRRGQHVCGLEIQDDRVRVHAGTPGGTVELTARYLVGCDGEDSTVRALAGVGFPGVDATHELLRADVVGIDVPDRRFERLPNGLAISSRRPDGVTRVMVSTFDRPVGRRTQPPSWEEITKVWELVTGEDIRHGTAIWRNAFDNASRLVSRYHEGRVLLAGDAAHCQMPSGGQAINLGIQDAANLGWKLAAVATGRAPDRLLDTYHDERHEIGRLVLSNIEAQGLLLLGGPEVDSTRAVLAELMGLSSAFTPEWTNRSASDAGTALLKLFSEELEPVLQRLNILPQNAYIQFLNTTGIQTRPATPAEALVQFTVANGATQPIPIPRGFQMSAAAAGGGPVAFETMSGLSAIPGTLTGIYAFEHDLYQAIDATTDNVPFLPFGQKPKPGRGRPSR